MTVVSAAEADKPAKAEQVVAKVNINTADVQTIADNLKGIGLKKAEAIAAYREELGGRFASIE